MESLAVPFQNIAQGINNIINLLNPSNENNIYNALFVVRDGYFESRVTAIRYLIEQKIPIVNDLVTIFASIQTSLVNGEVLEPPSIEIDLPAKYGGSKVQVVDFSIFAEYRFFIINIIRAIAWFFFMRSLIKKLPDIIY